MSAAPRFALEGVAAGYAGRPDVFSGVGLAIAPGTVVALLGENGSGKSTLLKLLARLVSARRGAVRFEGRDLAALPRKEAALAIGYLPQSFEPFFPATAYEIALLGRTPRLGTLGSFGAADERAVRGALEELDAARLSDVDVREMSGGERQRVLLARVLAGETRALLLDEPTANLDPRHRFLVVDALRRRAAAGASVLLSTHELEVASAAADEAILLGGGAVVAKGRLEETLTDALLTRLFGVAATVSRLPDGRPLVALGPLGGPSSKVESAAEAGARPAE